MKPPNISSLQRLVACVAALFFVILPGGTAGPEDLPGEDRLPAYLHSAPYDDLILQLRSMSAEEKADVLNTIKMNVSGNWTNARPDVLLYLGDSEQRKQMISQFRQKRWFYPELVKLGEPWVIEALAPEMFREETLTNLVQGDVFNYPLSYGVAGLIVANLQNATIYSDDVLQWAKRTSPHALPQLRATMRDWWRDNERFFKEKNYQAVRPGRNVPREESKGAATPVQPEPLASPPRAGETPLLPAPSRAAPPVAVAPNVESSSPSTALLITAATAAVALFVGVLFFWKRGSS